MSGAALERARAARALALLDRYAVAEELALEAAPGLLAPGPHGAALREALGALEGARPALEAEIDPSRRDRIVALIEACIEAGAAGAPATTVPEASRPRRLRALAAALAPAAGILLAAALLAFGLDLSVHRPSPTPGTVASTVLEHDHRVHGAAMAFDGVTGTEWRGQTFHTGWLERRFAPRRLRGVRVINGQGAPFMDRAMDRYRLLLFRGERAAQTFEGRFPNPRLRILGPPAPGAQVWRQDAFHFSTTEVDRLRLEVLTFHGRGLGVAEILLIDASDRPRRAPARGE